MGLWVILSSSLCFSVASNFIWYEGIIFLTRSFCEKSVHGGDMGTVVFGGRYYRRGIAFTSGWTM